MSPKLPWLLFKGGLRVTKNLGLEKPRLTRHSGEQHNPPEVVLRSPPEGLPRDPQWPGPDHPNPSRAPTSADILARGARYVTRLPSRLSFRNYAIKGKIRKFSYLGIVCALPIRSGGMQMG